MFNGIFMQVAMTGDWVKKNEMCLT